MARNVVKAVAATGGAAAILASLLVYKSLNSCVITESQATKLVQEELMRRGLDSKYLQGPTQSPGSCSYDFYYDGGGHRISYVAAEDPLHGPELHIWDYAADKNGP
jgi:hypothetical protein